MTVRAFVEPPVATPAEATLAPDESHYLVRVQRVGIGDPIELFDGEGRCFRGRITHVDPRATVVAILEPIATLSPPALDLAVGLIDPKAGLEVVGRACEAGAARLTWIRGARSQFGPPSAARCDRTLRASMRQSGRATLLRIDPPTTLSDWLGGRDGRPQWAAHTLDRHLVGPLPVAAPKGARLLVGPEGGWTPEEQQLIREADFASLSLGPWVLRTEHAVVAGLALLLGGCITSGA